MKFLYDIGIRSYGLGVMAAGLLGNPKAVKWVEGRSKWQSQISAVNWIDPVWIHASSLGEFEQAKPLIEKLKEHSKQQIIVTFFSPSGYEYCKDYNNADGVFYLPLDTKRNAREFLDIVKPKVAVFVKYDFWFNFLSELQARKIPILFFSCNFRARQVYFKRSASWQRNVMKRIDAIFCLNAKSEALLHKFEFSNTAICGDTRFDRVAQITERSEPISELEKFKGDNKLLILGSSWPVEEEILESYLKNQFPDDLKVIIAPHDISEEHLVAIEKRFERGMVRFSKVDEVQLANYKLLLIDNIGMLANLYQYGDIAFVGGGFTNSLHNILEAASMGNVLMYGSKVSKYPEGIQLNEFGGSYLLEDQKDFSEAMQALLMNPELRRKMSEKSKLFVNEHRGATLKVYKKVLEMLAN